MIAGKNYISTDTNEIMTFIGMNILMSIKRYLSYTAIEITSLHLWT